MIVSVFRQDGGGYAFRAIKHISLGHFCDTGYGSNAVAVYVVDGLTTTREEGQLIRTEANDGAICVMEGGNFKRLDTAIEGNKVGKVACAAKQWAWKVSQRVEEEVIDGGVDDAYEQGGEKLSRSMLTGRCAGEDYVHNH